MSDENPETAILSHEEIYRGKIVTLHVDTIRQASGTSTIREVVLHPGGVTAIPVLKDGRLLLIRQFRYPIGKFILELPAGKLDSGQTPLDTIARAAVSAILSHSRCRSVIVLVGPLGGLIPSNV